MDVEVIVLPLADKRKQQRDVDVEAVSYTHLLKPSINTWDISNGIRSACSSIRASNSSSCCLVSRSVNTNSALLILFHFSLYSSRDVYKRQLWHFGV